MLHDLLESESKWLSYSRLKSIESAKSILGEKQFKFSEGSKAKITQQCCIFSSSSFLKDHYYINNNNIAIVYVICVIINKNRCKKTNCETNIRQIYVHFISKQSFK